MRLELAEVLACPVCGPPQVMVAVVQESAGPRVRSGFLGCPGCESRFPITGGEVHLYDRSEAESPDPAEAPASGGTPATPPSETALLLAAVLGLGEGRGCVLLGPGLAPVAADLARAAGSWEVLSLVEAPRPNEDRPENLSRVVIAGASPPPVLRARFEGVAVAGRADIGSVRAFAAAVGPLGRLAIVGPEPRSEEVARAAGLRVIASDARVAVASREG